MSAASHPLRGAAFTDEPIEIAKNLWWVGARLPDEEFQCHAYLLKHGDQSVLFDPGSLLTWKETRRKLDGLIDFNDIRYFVLHHQDPDICSAMPMIEKQITREDAVWVTHWRAAVLLKHQAPRLPFWLIDEHDWCLDLGGRKLDFVFTPYLHFPGAFGTYDSAVKTFLSSDLFGGFSKDEMALADGMNDFEGVRAFHEHYMPTHDVLLHTMLNLEKLDIELIAPQHGKLIGDKDVKLYISRLKELDCGLFLLTHKDSDIQHLMSLNNLLRDTLETMVVERDFRVIAGHIMERVGDVMPIKNTEFLARMGNGSLLWLSASDRFRGTVIDSPPVFKAIDAVASSWKNHFKEALLEDGIPFEVDRVNDLVVPLFTNHDHAFMGFAILQMKDGFHPSAELDEILHRVTQPIGVAIERELVNRQLEMERDTVYERSIRDPLTNLFTRRYLDDSAKRMVELHRRDESAGFAMLMADIDHFKAVNDTYGHLAGDDVLKAVAAILIKNSRESDFPVRFGGEEFAIFLPLTSSTDGHVIAERIRSEVEALTVATDSGPVEVTISLGIAEHLAHEDLSDLIKKADVALYEAKDTGRNRICTFPTQ